VVVACEDEEGGEGQEGEGHVCVCIGGGSVSEVVCCPLRGTARHCAATLSVHAWRVSASAVHLSSFTDRRTSAPFSPHHKPTHTEDLDVPLVSIQFR
jgi:hypothetical protein